MKDRFSTDSQGYANFRPRYPQAMVDFIVSQAIGKQRAWDCATGNGQFATMLAPYFESVNATDISMNQLAQATQLPNIQYSNQPAELTNFEDKSFDLITVAQAIHWFDFERFYAEVRRVATNNAILAVIGYPLFSINPEIDAVIHQLHYHTLDKFWDKERHYLDEEYRTIPFPFTEIDAPKFASIYVWNFEQMMGYLNTWSAVKNHIRQNGTNPLEFVSEDLKAAWGDAETYPITFRMLLRMGVL